MAQVKRHQMLPFSVHKTHDYEKLPLCARMQIQGTAFDVIMQDGPSKFDLQRRTIL